MGKSAKVEDYAGFWAFCCKKHEIFTNPVFKNPGLYRKGILETFTRWPDSAPELLLLLLAVIFRYSTVIYISKGNLRNFHQMARFGSRTVALASRSHFQIFYSDNYRKGILETFTRWPNSAPELLLLLLAVIFRYSTVIYTWIFENRVNESFIFFEVVLILRLSLKDTVSKLRSKEVFLFMSAVFLHLLQQLVAWKGEAKKKQMQKKGNA